MVTTFTMSKSVDDVEDAILLPVDWYNVEIAQEPKLMMNKVLSNVVEANASDEEILAALEATDKAGYNLVVSLKTESPDAMFSNYDLTIWLGYPSQKDEKIFSRGQCLADKKIQLITAFTKAFGGDIQGKDIMLSEGMKGCVYVIQQRALNSEELQNGVDIFNAGFKKYQE